MQTTKKILGFAAAAALAVAIGAQQADAQNFTFTSIYADNTLTSGTSVVTITNGASVATIGTPTAIVLGNYSEFTTPGTGPNTFSAVPYTITLNLTDVASGQTLSNQFTGTISGSADGGVNNNAPSAFFTNTNTGPTFLNFTFAGGNYTVTPNFFVSPGPGGVNDGSYGATVLFTPAVTATPEPGTYAAMGLGVLGLAGLMFASRRRKITVA